MLTEHRGIFAAIEGGDGALAADRVDQHIRALPLAHHLTARCQRRAGTARVAV